MKILVVFKQAEIDAFPLEVARITSYLSERYGSVLVATSDRTDGMDSSVSARTYSHTVQSLLEGSESLLTRSEDIDIILVSNSHRIPSVFLWQSIYAEYVFTSRPLCFLSNHRIGCLVKKASRRDRRFGR